MPSSPLPDDLVRFVLTSVPSVPYLEALLLIRAQSGMTWSAADVAGRLYLPEQQAAQLLEELVSAGAALADQAALTYRYAPQTPELEALLARLANAYARSLLQVTKLIHSKADRRAHNFAEAFRWRKDQK